VQVLFEQGVLARNGAVRLVRPLTEIKVPPTVQAILAARIDRLPTDEKELLQTLAVLGKEFTLNQLKEVTAKSESELQRTLTDLQMADFIYEQPATGDIEYTFKHALTQEVAYSSILIERRKALHERAGAALEEVFAANLSDHYDELARHYRRSGNAPKAITYLRLAAEQAMSRSAYGEAAEPLNTALELLATLPATTERDRSESVLRLTLVISTIFNDLGALMIAATSESLERARELCAKAGKDSHREVLSDLAFIYANRSESKKAHAVCDELLEIATEMHDTDMIGRARFWEAFSSFWQGNFVAALEDFDRSYELPTSARSKRELSYGGWQTVTRSLGALTLFIVGYPEKASLRNREALALARESRDRSSLVPILIWSFFLNFLMRDPQAAYPQVEEARQLQREHGFAALSSVIEFWRGCTLVQLGQIEEGLAEMSPYLAALMQFVRTPVGSLIFPVLAAVYLTARRRDEGLETVAQGLETLQNNGNHNGEAELRRLRGELLLLGGDSGQEAAGCFREAIEVARRQSAKAWELRATTSLARLLASQSRRDEARTMLAEIYNWFTEGFDTADLIDAKALLDQLSA
jgi:tetratricopeptide (TPR) repeat protein